MRSSFVRFALTIGFGLLLAGTACADPPTPMLWKVTKGTNTVYLLGSMHLLKDNDYPLSPDVDAAYKDAKKLVFEISPDDLMSIAGTALMLRYSTYQDPTHKLQDDLQPATWKKLVEYGAKNNLPVAKLQTLEPWTVSQVVLVLESLKMGIRQDDGLDMHFMKLAAADHKSTAGFETVEQQVQLLHAAPLKVQEDMLRQSLDEIADFPKEMTEEHDTWRRGDGEAMVALARKEYAKYPELYRQMIADRNSNWIPQIEKLLNDGKGDTLVIVGALHLPGPDGVVHLLQEKGYSVEQICTGCTTIKH
jgi:uncharacterized protein